MKIFFTVFLVVFLAVSIGCRSTGVTRPVHNEIVITIADAVANSSDKMTLLEGQDGVGQLRMFLKQQLSRSQVRDSLKINIEIIEFRVSYGRDFITAVVAVEENGNVIKRFDTRETTGRSNPVYRLVKGLAKRIVAEIQYI